jgi:hypothetical protein
MAKKVKGSKPLALARTQLKESRKSKKPAIETVLAESAAKLNNTITEIVQPAIETPAQESKSADDDLHTGAAIGQEIGQINPDTGKVNEAPAKPAVTRSAEARSNISAGLAAHKLAGNPSKADLIYFFGKSGYLLTWPKRTEKFGVQPQDFQAALAKKRLEESK